MYTFLDGDHRLALRPEGTAVAVRMAISESLLHNQKQRLWYMGPMFRHERPQKGRYRQFHQFGIEAFGFQHPAIDAEVIAMGHRLWETLGLSDEIQLTLNTLGDAASRLAYKEALQAYFSRYQNDLDSATQERLISNPLRVLDSKDPQVRRLRRRVKVGLEEGLEKAGRNGCEVRITMNDGRKYRGRVEYARGEPENMMSDVEFEGKFRKLAGDLLPEESIVALIDACARLEDLEDVGRLVQLTRVGVPV